MSRARLVVLASGGGSNLQALIDYHAELGEQRAADLVLVASDRPDAGALQRARTAGIEAATILSRRDALAPPLSLLLEQHSADLVALAGYVQLIPADIVRRHPRRILNIHPAPLPRFGGKGMYGMNVHRALIEAGAEHSGPTVHFVDEEYDRGATIAHWPVPVIEGDDAEDIAARVLRAEHRLYPRVIEAVARGLTGDEPIELPPFDPHKNDLQLGTVVDEALSLR